MAEVPNALQGGWNLRHNVVRILVVEPLIGSKEEQLVPAVEQLRDDHRAADVAPVFVHAVLAALDALLIVAKPVRVQVLVAETVIEPTVEQIGSALRSHGDQALGIAGVRREAVGYNPHLLERVAIGNHRGLMPRGTLHRDAIQLDVACAQRSTVDADGGHGLPVCESHAQHMAVVHLRSWHHAGLQGGIVQRVVVDVGQILDEFLVHGTLDRRVLGLEGYGVGLHLDSDVHPSGDQRCIRADGGSCAHNDAGLAVGFETLSLYHERVPAGRKIRHRIIPRVVACGFRGYISFLVLNRYGRFRNDSAGRVCNGPRNRTGLYLCEDDAADQPQTGTNGE